MCTSNGQRLDGQGAERVRLENDAYTNLRLQVRVINANANANAKTVLSPRKYNGSAASCMAKFTRHGGRA